MRKWKSLTLSPAGGKLREQKEARYEVWYRCGLLSGVLHTKVKSEKDILNIFFLEWISTKSEKVKKLPPRYDW